MNDLIAKNELTSAAWSIRRCQWMINHPRPAGISFSYFLKIASHLPFDGFLASIKGVIKLLDRNGRLVQWPFKFVPIVDHWHVVL
jgi:hypothetical protein